MRRWISFAFLGLISLSGWAGDAPPFTCTANVAVPPILRSEGFTELTGDITLSCSGGTPTPAKQVIPTGTFTLTLNTPVTSRLINQSGRSEALLLIDEPGSSENPGPISLCTAPGGCPVIFNGTGQGNFNGSAGHLNAFTGIVSGNEVAFQGIPILAPVTTGSPRIYRITNVRANVAALSPGGNQASIGQVTIPRIQASPSMTFSSGPATGTQIPIINGTSPSNPHGPLTVGFPTQGPSFQVVYNPTTVTPSQIPFTIFLGAQENGFNLWKATSQSSNLTDPFGVLPTTIIPVPRCACESGTVIKNPFTGKLIGAADHGTVFQLSVIVPPGAGVTVPIELPLTSGANTNAGTILWNAIGAVQSGPNITVTADPTGSVELFGLVAEASLTTSEKAFDLPITIGGTFSQVPFNVQASLFYAPGLSPTNTLAFSSLFPGIPAFHGANLDGSQPLDTDTVASVVNSTSGIGPLQYLAGIGGATVHSLLLSSKSSQVAFPPAMDISIVTSGEALSNISVTKDPAATWLNVILNQNTTPASASLSFNPTAKPANYSTTLTFTSPNLSTPLTVPVEYNTFFDPWFDRRGFVNAASNVSDVVAPGEAFTIFGHNFGPSTIAKSTPNATKDQTTLAKTQVMFDDTPAALSSVQNAPTGSFVTGFAPFELTGKTTTKVKIVYNGVASPPVTLNVIDAVPGIFTVNSSGTGQAMVINADNSMNSDSHRAPRGSVVTAIATGGGLTVPGSHDGVLTGSPAPKLNLNVKVFLDGVLVTSSTRSESGNYDEILAVKLRIPTTARANADLPLMIQIGDKVSQPGVTVAVK